MAERFESNNVPVTVKGRLDILEEAKKGTGPGLLIIHPHLAIDLSTEFVDLYLGNGPDETHIRWNRKSGLEVKPDVKVSPRGSEVEGVRNLPSGRAEGTKDRQEQPRSRTKKAT